MCPQGPAGLDRLEAFLVITAEEGFLLAASG